MITFIIALKSEAEPLIGKMNTSSDKTVFGREIIKGKLCGVKTQIVICGVGKVNAASATQYAVDKLKADKIVNVGTAGGLNPSVEVGRIYSVTEAVQYDFDLAALNGTETGTLNEYEEPYLAASTPAIFPEKRLATGDRFNDDKNDYKLLTKTLKADLRDMEGGAILHACTRLGVPCYLFKVISDVAGKGSTPEQFSKNLQECARSLSENAEKIIAAVK